MADIDEVKRVRGKHLAWLPLIVMVLGIVLVRPGFSQTTTMSVQPSEVLGVPGDIFEVDVTVTDVADLYTYAFELHYEPAVRILSVVKVIEGDFLGPITGEPEFSVTSIPLEGIVQVGDTLTGNVSGYSGSGVLATIRCEVLEAGECPLTLHETGLISSTGVQIPHDIVDGMYVGPKCTLDRARTHGGWFWFLGFPGDTATFDSRVTNPGQGRIPLPLEAQVRFDLTRYSDGRVSTVWAGQSYVSTPRPALEYLYVDEFDEWYYEWDNPPENVFGDADGQYIEASANALWACLYSFENITLGPGDAIETVTIEGYCQYPNGYYEGADIDVYIIDPCPFAWMGSLWGTETWDWHGVRWTTDTVDVACPAIQGKDPSILNGLTILIYSYYADADNPIRVDALRLRVEFARAWPITPPSFTVNATQTLDLDAASWTLGTEDVGFYTGTATVLFSYTGDNFNVGNTRRVWLWVLPPWPWW